jgi:hypothetical protein
MSQDQSSGGELSQDTFVPKPVIPQRHDQDTQALSAIEGYQDFTHLK